MNPDNVNAEGRVCVQIGVLGHPGQPFTDGALRGIDAIVSWLDSWGVSRRWPAGRPRGTGSTCPPAAGGARRPAQPRAWARGGHFGASQVPGCENAGPGAIEIDRITGISGPHGLQVRARGLPSPRAEAAALAIPA